jgi:ubiquinone/menaquinone biosynthesis C-methylase UbiE
MTVDTPAGGTQARHSEHHEPEGVVRQFVYTVSMLFGRGNMARVVARIANLSTSDAVVDVGCGPGAAVRQARKSGAARAVGIDPSPHMLRVARRVTTFRHLDGAVFLEGTAENVPLDARSANVVWAIQSVHHWKNPRQGLRESRRVLAPGGRLILAEKSVTPGARGHARHGLTEEQADEMVRLIAQTGFVGVTKQSVSAGRRTLVVITASAPAQ